VESRRQGPAHKRNPRLRDNAGASNSVHADLPHIVALIADGEITVAYSIPWAVSQWPPMVTTSSAPGQKKSLSMRLILLSHPPSELALNAEGGLRQDGTARSLTVFQHLVWIIRLPTAVAD
jgi:hypothetical protein